MRKIFVMICISAASLFGTTSFATVSDNQVTSQKIKEADGTTGQDTNAGSGVKTGHIQDGAVTTSKIADAAVTDAKIGGGLSQSKVNGLEASLAGKADATHNHDIVYQQKYGKVAVVALTGGDYASPAAAITNLSAWCGSPSASNPCLVKIMPGTYVITSTLYMQGYVDMEGSGENVTMIAANNIGTAVNGASNSELRHLTLNVTGGTALYHNQVVGPQKISHVTINASDATGIHARGARAVIDHLTLNATFSTVFYQYGVIFEPGANSGGLTIDDSNITLNGGTGNGSCFAVSNGISTIRNTKINATCMDARGVYSYYNNSVTIDNSEIVSNGAAVQAIGGALIVRNSVLEGGNSVYSNYSQVKVSNSQLTGSIAGNGTFACFNNYDSNLAAVTCP